MQTQSTTTNSPINTATTTQANQEDPDSLLFNSWSHTDTSTNETTGTNVSEESTNNNQAATSLYETSRPASIANTSLPHSSVEDKIIQIFIDNAIATSKGNPPPHPLPIERLFSALEKTTDIKMTDRKKQAIKDYLKLIEKGQVNDLDGDGKIGVSDFKRIWKTSTMHKAETDKEKIKKSIEYYLKQASVNNTSLPDYMSPLVAALLSDLTGEAVTEKREKAVTDFLKTLKEKGNLDLNGDGKTNIDDILKAFKEGSIGNGSGGNNDPNKIKQIEVLSGGVDYLAGTGMTLKIGDKMYKAGYSGFGIDFDSLESEDGSPVDENIAALIKKYESQIIAVAGAMSYGEDVDNIIPVDESEESNDDGEITLNTSNQ